MCALATPPPLFILADDLTGAADSAARWRACGLPADVVLRLHQRPHNTSAIAFTSDSRHLAPEQAAERIHAILAQINAPANTRWYKKIDSTLRGNLGAEIDATLSALGRSHALICPAFPQQGRGLINATLVCDPAIAPAQHLPSRLAAQTNRPIACIPLAQVHAGPAPLAQALQEAAQYASLLICDAQTEQDLNTLAAAANTLPEALLCGSAGLIGALARQQIHGAPPRPFPPVQHTLVVVGSGSSMAHQQILALRQHQFRMPNLQLLNLPPPDPTLALDGPETRTAAARLADQALDQIRTQPPDLIILVGGDTAMAVMERMAIERLTILCELLPGIPFAQSYTAKGPGCLVVLKAGNFGTPQTLVELIGFTTRPTRP